MKNTSHEYSLETGEPESNYHALFEQATDSIMITDFEGNFKDVNSGLCLMFGYSKMELLQMNVRSLLDEQDLKEKPIAFQLLAEGRNIFNERKMVHKNGTIIYVESNARKIHDTRILVIARDVTERKNIERKLLNVRVEEQKKITRAVLKAQEIERNKIGQELHDNVNQVLSSIHLHLCMIGDGSVEKRELLEKAKEYVNLAMNEIRALSREQVTPLPKFNLKELIEDLCSNLNENTNVRTAFHCNVAENLRIEEDLKLNIYRIIQEQTHNILKYADASKATISIHEQNKFVHVLILDNGKGFDPLTKRKGIGLSNMTNRIESFNGEMHVETSPGNGCKIEMTIPAI